VVDNATQEKPIARVKGDFPLYKLMVRSKVKAAHVTEVEAAVKRVFAALQNEQPNGIRYSEQLTVIGSYRFF
jgi:hypothetical protein